jgi:hypothetical protein
LLGGETQLYLLVYVDFFHQREAFFSVQTGATGAEPYQTE